MVISWAVHLQWVYWNHQKENNKSNGSGGIDMDKEKMDACKQRMMEAAQWGKSQLTPKRLKKGAGCLLALAIVAGGGKIALHQQKAQAHAQEAQARTEMLQNLAAQQNIQLVSTDQVKENIASALGTDPSSITFKSVTLDDRKPGEPGKDHKEYKKDKKDKKDKEQKKDSRKYKENDRKDRDSRKGQMPMGQPGGAPGQNGQNGQQGQPPMMPGSQNDSQRPDGLPGENSQNGQDRGQEGLQPQGFPQHQMAKEAKASAFPGVYLAQCEKDGMRYSFLVDAQSGQVLRGQVHKMNPIQQLFS